MDLYYIDYISVYGKSWLHRFPAALKMAALAAVITFLLYTHTAVILAAAGIIILAAAITARLPMKLYIGLTLYPLLLLIVIFLSTNGLTLLSALTFALRTLAITGSVVLFFLTTSYPAIFSTLSRFLPQFLIAALFFTYRSIFVISDSLNNVWTAMRLRGGIDWKRPGFTISRLGDALGHFLIHSIEASEEMADSLRLRGFSGRVYYLGKNDEE